MVKFNKKQWVIFQIDEATTTVEPLVEGPDVDKEYSQSKFGDGDDGCQKVCYDPLVEEILKNYAKQPVYALVDVSFNLPNDQGQRNKLVMIAWCPSGAPLKKKMKFGSTTDNIKGQFQPHFKLFGDCAGDLEWSELMKELH